MLSGDLYASGIVILGLAAILANVGVSYDTRIKILEGQTTGQIEQSWQTKNPIYNYGTIPGRYYTHANYWVAKIQ